MAQSTKKTTVKRPSAGKKATQKQPENLLTKLRRVAQHSYEKAIVRQRQFLSRRPHRSFRRTRRRDYARSLEMPGYIAFTLQVSRTLRRQWRAFLWLALLYSFIMIALGAITSQDVYTTIRDLLSGTSQEASGGGLAALGEAALVALATFASGSNNLTAEQGVYLAFTLLFVWLATVWLLRETAVSRKPRLRDALYNSGAPILSTVGVLLVMVVQLVPIGLTMLLYAALSAMGAVGDGFGAMLFWLFAAAVTALVLYWTTSTVLALVVVTIPGMYPLRAVGIAGDLVVGRRLRILLRLLWGAVVALLGWALVLLLSVLLDKLVRMSFPDIADMSVVPYVGAIVSSFAMIWFAAYVYLFYRKVVDDDAKPA